MWCSYLAVAVRGAWQGGVREGEARTASPPWLPRAATLLTGSSPAASPRPPVGPMSAQEEYSTVSSLSSHCMRYRSSLERAVVPGDQEYPACLACLAWRGKSYCEIKTDKLWVDF